VHYPTCILVQMATAKRHLTVPRRRKLAVTSSTALWGSISRWRGSRGLLHCPCPALGSKHAGCTKRVPYAALENGLFLCEGCGWAHVCGDGCTERQVDVESETLVCPVSGRCFSRMLADWEVGLLAFLQVSWHSGPHDVQHFQ